VLGFFFFPVFFFFLSFRLLEVGDEANAIRVNNSKRLSFSEKRCCLGLRIDFSRYKDYNKEKYKEVLSYGLNS
ncbi:hypothetical protein, partial [Streptococcus suis]|uniref:hypothetical protein n=1 Tax=Streptococcus suis TaxID=1307 RepID=UPI001EE6B615